MRNSHSHSRISSIGNHRFDICRIKTNLLIEYGIIIALQRLPIFQSFVPRLPLRSTFTPLDIFKSHFVRSHHTTTCTHFDRKVTESKASFHSQITDSRAGIFYKVSGSTACSHLRHHIKRHIFCSHSFAQFTVHCDTHCFRPRLENTLRCQHHFHLTGSDTESDCSHSTVSRSV